MITNITIENIKGFSTINNSIEVELKPNKVNVLVAPNGFGKSSITTAFTSLKTNRLEVGIDDLHQNDQSLIPKLSLTIDGNTYFATPSENQLSSIVEVFTIRNRLKAKSISRNIGGKFYTTSSSLSIEKIEVIKTIPLKQEIDFSITSIKKGFGDNAKVLNSISSFLNDNNFVIGLENSLDNLKLIIQKRNWRMMENLCAKINLAHGKTDAIKESIDESDLSFLKNEPFVYVVRYIKTFDPSINDIDAALFVYQLAKCYDDNKTKIKKVIKYYKYIKFKRDLNNDLELLDSTWKNIKAEERDHSLIVNFPLANAISYGQRDLLTLIVQLRQFAYNIRPNKKCILIIDEVFDYLDAVNMTVIQYYLSNFIQEWKHENELYTIIMTHLSPEYFHNYVFSKSRLNVQYLMSGGALPTKRWRTFLVKREEEAIKDDVSKYLLHYNPSFISGYRYIFKSLSLPETWGEGDRFHKELLTNINRYLSGSLEYDPYAVCTIVRIRIEKLVYDKLDECQRNVFIEKHHGTKNKLEFAESFVDVPDSFYLLGIIYNDAEHLKNENSDKPIIYRLDHIAIKEMIRKLFPNREIVMSDIH